MTAALSPVTTRITGCLLAGGEGRRMQGRDKGLIPYQGQPLGEWVLQALAPQTDVLAVSANRNLSDYQAMLARQPQSPIVAQAPLAVWPDDPDLPPASGPLAGILTALRHCQTEWLLVAPCDIPHLPADLVERLMAEASRVQADIAVPLTHEADGATHLHWACALVHKRVCPETEALFVTGERKVGNWVRSQRWVGVSFAHALAFTNMNTPETLHGRA
jgi:molybdenum cofactor guanylyltransferase